MWFNPKTLGPIPSVSIQRGCSRPLRAFSTFVLHIAASGGYGYQRDELYFVWCARHLAWGYVDQPPLIALIARFELQVFGDSLTALRLLPALAAAATVVLTGRVARILGGGPFAQGLAMLALALAPFYLAVGNLLTMNAFEPLLWMSAAYLFAEAEQKIGSGSGSHSASSSVWASTTSTRCSSS